MSLRYLYDIESISLRHCNDVIVTIWIRHQIHIVATLNPYYNIIDMDSTLQRYGFDVKIVIISMSNPYGNDIVTTLSFRYGFDIAMIWIQCRIHMVTITSLRCCNDMDSTSCRYRNDIKSISKR